MVNHWSTYILLCVGAAIFSLILNRILLRFSKNLGVRDHSDKIIRWSTHAKPSLGGISFYVLFLLSIFAYSFFFDSTVIFDDSRVTGLIMVCTFAFFIGLADDAYNTKPGLKFIGQVICGLILVFTGTVIHIFPNVYLNYAFTVLWVVGMMNSLNMLDNMDAITTTVSINVLLAAVMVMVVDAGSQNVYLWLMVAMLGTLAGFLYYNWHPSKLFMGDTGSQFLGVFLAAIGVVCFWNSADANGQTIQTKQFFVTILTFLIPIVDTTIVVLNRIMRGHSPFVGGKDHTTHHLSYFGLSDRMVAVIFALLSFFSMLGTLMILKYIDGWDYIHITLFTTYFIVVFGVLYYITKITKPPFVNDKKIN